MSLTTFLFGDQAEVFINARKQHQQALEDARTFGLTLLAAHRQHGNDTLATEFTDAATLDGVQHYAKTEKQLNEFKTKGVDMYLPSNGTFRREITRFAAEIGLI